MQRMLGALVIIFLFCGFTGETNGIVNAIFYAEGGKRASKPYGVMSKDCDWGHVAVCRERCRNLVARYQGNVEALQAVYAPTSGKGLRPAEKKLNPNWARNVIAIYKRHHETH